MSNRTASASASRAPATVLFNEFLTRSVRNSDLKVEHRRVLVRQPENEIFVRKALVAMHRLAPEVKVEASSTELLADDPRDGRANLARVASRYLAGSPALAAYVREPAPGRFAAPAVSPINLFTLLHSYAYQALSEDMKATPFFGVSAATCAAALSGQADSLRPRVKDAANSAFAQAFADVHALSLLASINGSDVALEALTEVQRRREAGGDFGSFSLAPLSQDSSAALQMLRYQLQSGKDFSAMSRVQLLGHSLWIAADGLGSWLQKHGHSDRTAAGVAFALESASHVAAGASASLASEPRTPVRPV